MEYEQKEIEYEKQRTIEHDDIMEEIGNEIEIYDRISPN